MICPKCKQQWAEFWPKDWDENPDPKDGELLFIPRHPLAEEKRRQEWESKEEKICPECEEALEAEKEARMLSEVIYSIWGPRLLGAAE